MQRKTHVGTAIVDSVNFIVVMKQNQRMILDLDGEAVGFLKIIQAGSLHRVTVHRSHGKNSFSNPHFAG
jgi:hypothetical protein